MLSVAEILIQEVNDELLRRKRQPLSDKQEAALRSRYQPYVVVSLTDKEHRIFSGVGNHGLVRRLVKRAAEVITEKGSLVEWGVV